MSRYRSLKEYLSALEAELEGSDPALIVDARDDAEEHLTELMADLVGSGACPGHGEALRKAVEQYGSPAEVAAEYLRQEGEMALDRDPRKSVTSETRVPSGGKLGGTVRVAGTGPRTGGGKVGGREGGSLAGRIVGVWAEGMTYKNMLYLFLMFPLGILYFTYLVTGLAVSLGLVFTLVGIPLLILFLLSFTGISWFHGRLTEALVGIRMPRRRRNLKKKGSFWKRVKRTLKDPRLYSSVLYLFLIFPLGIIYFTVMVTFLATSLGLSLLPVISLIGRGLDLSVYLPLPMWFQVLAAVLGLVMLTWTLHLVRLMARLQGGMTKVLLIRR